MTNKPPKPAKITGLAHVFAAAGYSAAGFRRLLKETAFRHELIAAGTALALLWALGADAGALMIMAVLALAAMAVEALNSAIEEIVDLVSPEWSEAAKNAKDMGSFAVMAMLLACAVYFLYALASLTAG